MAYITVTNTFQNNTSADATQVNANFTDITGGLTNGTKDIQVSNVLTSGLLKNVGGTCSIDMTTSGLMTITPVNGVVRIFGAVQQILMKASAAINDAGSITNYATGTFVVDGAAGDLELSCGTAGAVVLNSGTYVYKFKYPSMLPATTASVATGGLFVDSSWNLRVRVS
jgi:hypothetical protein